VIRAQNDRRHLWDSGVLRTPQQFAAERCANSAALPGVIDYNAQFAPGTTVRGQSDQLSVELGDQRLTSGYGLHDGCIHLHTSGVKALIEALG
jgi:hypothetical protein